MATEDTVKWETLDHALAIVYLATATCVVYDHLTTLGDEIELVWQRQKWSPVQYLFLLNRYLGDATQIYAAFVFIRHVQQGTQKVGDFDHPANVLGLTHNLGGLRIGFFFLPELCVDPSAAESIMVYRISSMYNHRRDIIVLLGTALCLEMISIVIIPTVSEIKHTPIDLPDTDVRFCTQNVFAHWMFTIWIPIILFESLILGLALSLALIYHRTIEGVADLQEEMPTAQVEPFFETKPESLAYILLRDSITFPFILCIANFVVWITQPYVIIQIAFAVAAFAPCIIGSRLILNLREAYYLPFVEECNPHESLIASGRELVGDHDDNDNENENESGGVTPTENIHLITLNHASRSRQNTMVSSLRRSSNEGLQ
ncbi:hypothetical protein D9613_002493 [Agrocybe pediades]|uniref:DUF6533 domain-containing protein n=1 Tax=Agrocybe pediades TaxID=84607 RepID=A0A8H4VLM4_9AGAR|nr:hypothetical protein D9613_002493 [Agrocybe pediades]